MNLSLLFFSFLVDTSEKGLISLGALSVYISIKLPTSFEVSSYPLYIVHRPFVHPLSSFTLSPAPAG